MMIWYNINANLIKNEKKDERNRNVRNVCYAVSSLWS